MEENTQFVNPASQSQLVVNEIAKEFLISGSKWMKFLTIVQSIGVAFLVVIAIMMMAVPSFLSAISHEPEVAAAGKLGGMIVGFIYLVIAAIEIYLIVIQFNFIKHTQLACYRNNSLELQEACHCMKKWMKFCGIVTIAVFALYALCLLVIFVAAALGMA